MSVITFGVRRLSSAAFLLSIALPAASFAQSSKPTGGKVITGKAGGAAAVAVIPGYFTVAQAARGEKVFAAQCATCHARKDLSSPDFHLKWNGRTVFDLFERLQSTMPESDPGSLSAAEYADVVAYLMKLNGMPAGKMVVAPGPALKKQKLVMGSAR
jgi:mono/diheme cytochrome c family protein